MRGEELLGQAPHLVEFAHVGEQVGDLGGRRRPEHLVHGAPGPVVAPCRQHHTCAEAGHALGGGQSDAGRGPGDQHGPACKRRRRGPARRPAAHRRADRGEAPHHGGFERLVHGPGHHRTGLWPIRGDRRTAERAPQPGHPLVADPVECEREERVCHGERTLESEIGLIGEDRATVGRRRHRDGVLGPDGVRLPQQDDPPRPVVGDDPVVERHDPGPDPDPEPEGAAQAHGAVVELLGTGRAGVPLRGIGEVGHVVEGRPGRDHSSPVAGHGGSILFAGRGPTVRRAVPSKYTGPPGVSDRRHPDPSAPPNTGRQRRARPGSRPDR